MRKLRKLQILRLAILGFCLLISGILLCWNASLCGLLAGQQAAERWGNEMKAAQISVFLCPDADFSTDSIQSLHETVDAELTSQSLKSENKYARLWYDAYSTQAGQTEVAGNRKGRTNALLTVIGGDFFLIHAPKLISGGYFTEQDVMHDRVVIDTQLAWDLFGSSDVAGMEITVQGVSCLIAGVIQPETDYASKTAYGTTPRIYIPYALYQQFDSEAAKHISCYEAVLPNPVRNFAKELLKKSINLTEDTNTIILQNTGRYSISARWNTLKKLRSLVVCETVTFPYWENAARIISFDTAMILLLQIFFLLYPIIYLIWLICKAYCFSEKKIFEKRLAWKNRYRSKIKQI